MNLKQVAMTGVTTGSFVGSLIPLLWGDDFLSISSVIFTALGGILGVYITYKVVHN